MSVRRKREGRRQRQRQRERVCARACLFRVRKRMSVFMRTRVGAHGYMCVKVPEVYVVERKHVCAREIKHQHVDNRTLLGPNNMPRGVASLASLVALEWEVWKSVAIPPRGC